MESLPPYFRWQAFLCGYGLRLFSGGREVRACSGGAYVLD